MNRTIACAEGRHNICIGHATSDTKAGHLTLIITCQCEHHERDQAMNAHPAGSRMFRVHKYADWRSNGDQKYRSYIISYLIGVTSRAEFDDVCGADGHADYISEEFDKWTRPRS
jgi:hypothetical protein